MNKKFLHALKNKDFATLMSIIIDNSDEGLQLIDSLDDDELATFLVMVCSYFTTAIGAVGNKEPDVATLYNLAVLQSELRNLEKNAAIIPFIKTAILLAWILLDYRKGKRPKQGA